MSTGAKIPFNPPPRPAQQGKNNSSQQKAFQPQTVGDRGLPSDGPSGRHPVAPPIYRPPPQPKVLQAKSVHVQRQPPTAQLRRTPPAPPVYRPQQVPKMLQRKTAGATSQTPAVQTRPTPKAPPVYRPQPLPGVLQPKAAGGQQPPTGKSPHRPAAPPIYRPNTKKVVQPKMSATAQPRNVPVAPRLSSTRTIIQRKATFTSSGRDVTNAANGHVWTAFRDNRQAVSNILPADWRVGNTLLPSKIKSGVEALLADSTDHGVFDLNKPEDVERLARLLASASRTTTSNIQSQPVIVSSPKQQPGPTIENPRPQVSLGTGQSQRQYNKFTVEPAASKDDVLKVLDGWNKYYEKHKGLSPELKEHTNYQNFKNSGSMVETVEKAINNKKDEDISKTVRIAKNPNDPKQRVAAVIVYSWEPRGGGPTYVADVLAHPKSLKPPEPPKPNKIKSGSEAFIKGGGRALLENAVLESTPAGIELWPLNGEARKQYLNMKFVGEEGFKPDPLDTKNAEDKRHLVLKPENINVFAANTGLSKEVIDKWREKHQ